MRRRDRPHVCWVIEHLADLCFFTTAAPALLYLLFGASV